MGTLPTSHIVRRGYMHGYQDDDEEQNHDGC